MFDVAVSRPDDIDGLVVVEPTGCPTAADDAPHVPFLAVYGDYVEPRGQAGRFDSCQTTRDLVEDAGHPAAFFDCPGQGVAGNTHLPMQDDNNDGIAADILDWLDAVDPR